MRFLFSCHPQPLADDTSFTQSLRKRVEYLASSNSFKLSSLFQYSLENAYLFQFFARVSCPKVSILAGHRIGFQIKFDKAIFYGFDAFSQSAVSRATFKMSKRACPCFEDADHDIRKEFFKGVFICRICGT